MLGTIQLEISIIEYKQTQLPKRMITYIRIWLLWILQAAKKLNGLGLVMNLPYMVLEPGNEAIIDGHRVVTAKFVLFTITGTSCLLFIILVVVMPRPTPSFCYQLCSTLIAGLPPPSFPLLHPIT